MRNSFGKALMGAAGGSGGAGFAITPTVAGSTVVNAWDFGDDGDLILGAGTNGAAGIAYEITVSSSLSVNIDMWGGGAASGWYYTVYYPGGNGPGGGGGHTTADVVLNAGTYTIHVGGGGKSFPIYSSGPSSPSRADYRSGGCPLLWGTEGAGYSGLFKTATISQSNAMLIAGGGGGGGSSPTYGGVGGAGGGASGAATNGGAQGGYGGTQSAGGASSPYNSATAGSALSGGTGHTLWGPYASLGGGGAGYYGGGGGNVGGGGGGSGYIDTSDSDITNEVTTAGSANVPGDNSNSRRSGNGSPGAGGTAGQGHSGLFYMSAN